MIYNHRSIHSLPLYNLLKWLIYSLILACYMIHTHICQLLYSHAVRGLRMAHTVNIHQSRRKFRNGREPPNIQTSAHCKQIRQLRTMAHMTPNSQLSDVVIVEV